MLIDLIRHGETAYNVEKRYQGTRDIPLSPAGREKLFRAEFCPETVFVTPLRRTRETAEILFPEAAYAEVPDLREMEFGIFEGKNYIELEHDPAYREWVDGGCMGRCPGGESRPDFSARVLRAFCALVDSALARGETRLTIVAHGGTIMSVMERYGRPEKSYHDWLPGNASGYLLDTEPWPEYLRLQSIVCYQENG